MKWIVLGVLSAADLVLIVVIAKSLRDLVLRRRALREQVAEADARAGLERALVSEPETFVGGGGRSGGAGASGMWEPSASQDSPAPDFSDVQSESSSSAPDAGSNDGGGGE